MKKANLESRRDALSSVLLCPAIHAGVTLTSYTYLNIAADQVHTLRATIVLNDSRTLEHDGVDLVSTFPWSQS